MVTRFHNVVDFLATLVEALCQVSLSLNYYLHLSETCASVLNSEHISICQV